MTTAAIIVAAGRGLRANKGSNQTDLPKQYQAIGGLPVISHTLSALSEHSNIDVIAIVIHPDYEPLLKTLIIDYPQKPILIVHGGETRQHSVQKGLQALDSHARKPDLVLIHDGARPFVDAALCDRVIAGLEHHDGALPAIPVADTLKRIVNGDNKRIVNGDNKRIVNGDNKRIVNGDNKRIENNNVDKADTGKTSIETVDRSDLYAAQTPQGFRFEAILRAHALAANSGRDDFTDDASIGEWQNLDITLVEGHADNHKITTADDLAAADQKLKCENALNNKTSATGGETDNRASSTQLEFRTGTGFDVHKFGDGNHVILCGVTIPHVCGLMGHSDADVGLHALTDALLGAIGDGDIGMHFPPSDPKWKGAQSDQFLIHAAELVAKRGGTITHVDVTLICEAPKIGPHRDTIRARLSEILNLSLDRVSVKATTTEGLGFAGRREGIASMASATVALPLDL